MGRLICWGCARGWPTRPLEIDGRTIIIHKIPHFAMPCHTPPAPSPVYDWYVS
jgi:hypothetical protein